jgi:hypothetical protein
VLLAPPSSFYEFTHRSEVVLFIAVVFFVGLIHMVVWLIHMVSSGIKASCQYISEAVDAIYKLKVRVDKKRRPRRATRKQLNRVLPPLPVGVSISESQPGEKSSTNLAPGCVTARPLPPARARADDPASSLSHVRSATLPLPFPELKPARTRPSRR